MVKTSKYIGAFLFFLLFSLFVIIPQINVSGYVQPTITSKFICFLYACCIILGGCLLFMLVSKKTAFFITKLDIVLLVLIIYISLNRYGIQPRFGFSVRYMELVGLSFLYVVLRRLSVINYSWLLVAIVISGIFQAVYGNLQLLGYYPSNHSGFKMTGSFFNPGPFAGFLVSVWSVALGMYLFKDSIITQLQSQTKKDLFLNGFIKQVFEYIPLLGLISIAIVLPATRSRAAWIAAISCSLILLEFRYCILNGLFQKISIFKRTILITVCIGIISAGLFSVYHFKKGSSDGRSFIWKVSSEMIKEAPIFGVGFDRFKAVYMDHQASYFVLNGETPQAMVADNTYYAFNEWLQFVVENGLLGFLFLMLAVAILLKTKANPVGHPEVFIAKIGLLTICAFACFSYPMQILPIKLVLIFFLAMLSNSTVNTFQFKFGKNTKILWTTKTFVLLLGSIFIFQTVSYTKNLSQGFIAWGDALSSHQYGDYEGSIATYQSVYPVFKNDGDFLMNYGKTLAKAGNHTKAIEVLERARHFLNTTVIATTLGDSYKAIQQYDKAEVAYKQAIHMIPSKFYANYLLVKLYYDSGQVTKATAMAEKILSKEVKIPSTAIKEIREEMKKMLKKI